MKYNPFFLLLIISSCSAPISYVNNVPRSSGLKEAGDASIRAGLGSDFKGKDQVIQIGGTWSPIQRIGLDLEYSGRMNLFNSKRSFDKLTALNSSIIYYIPMENRSGLEFSLSYGFGIVRGEHNPEARLGGDPTGRIYLSLFEDEFIIDTEFETISGQVNYNLYDQSDNAELSIGMRVRSIDFEKYYYETNKDLISDAFQTLTLDPFIEMNNELGRFLINARLSYSYFPEGTYSVKRVHPHFSKVAVALGLQYRFGNVN
ncbi:hypothetical protein [Ekhidna sp.]|uniref:hypothetical protein n=1 Tax=Ekhidna sp. TaxID=2608089 RepID=UPI003298412B